MGTNMANTIGALGTSLEILEALKERGSAGVTELATELDLPKSTVYSHLRTLREHGYVVQRDERYCIGLKFLSLGEHTRDRMPLYEVAKPEVKGLAEQTGELANLLVEEHGEGVYLFRSKGEQAVSLDTHAGMRVKLHCTSLGKAILAYLPEVRVDEIIERWGLPAQTATTITSREALEEELAAVRERGYAYDKGERLSGLRCIAAPIKNPDGHAIGAVSVSGPTSRMKGERFESEIPEQVMSAANVIELNLTYS
ncbi:IclR family transcriptional regulator [Haloferax sulfurifontis]|uniref:IclR family transcriptional regulator n=1 Tax=Haloferax sulfurifontis TaxID=255616 RepID=A0A830E027_9EURY|nr:IclR family transcriptional regulator [Haloferax sulfurifontis]GGC64362.1 IclR family transcriptional regulator [Haloferax sulfurifontis]